MMDNGRSIMAAVSDYGLKPAILSTDPEAVQRRKECDYTIKVSLEEARAGAAKRPVRVFVDGIFDLFHYGHAILFHQVKNAFPNVYLLAGVTDDEQTHQVKGPTVLSQLERVEAVRHCRYVDEVIVDNPYWITWEFMNKHKIDFVAHDDLPYPFVSAEGDDGYGRFKAAGMFLPTTRTEGISTTNLIDRLLTRRSLYEERNRKRNETDQNNKGD